MKTYRVAYNHEGRSHAKYVKDISPAAAEIAVEKMQGVRAKMAVEVPDGVASDREWADASR